MIMVSVRLERLPNFVFRTSEAVSKAPATSRTAVSDARTRLAAVGTLQLPRTRTERNRHLEILNRVPFDIVPAFNERLDIQSRTQPIKGSIGRIMRRYRKDGVSTVLNTMLQACVDKRFDELLWDTIATSLYDEMPNMTAADVGIALNCLIKAGYKRSRDLPERLVQRLVGAAAPAVGSPTLSSTSPRLKTTDRSQTPTLAAGGRRHKRMQVLPKSQERTKRTSTSNRSAIQKIGASEHALSAAFAALHYFKLYQSLSLHTHRLCLITSRLCPALSNRVLCRIAHHAGSITDSMKRKGSVVNLLETVRQELCRRLDVDSGDQDWVVGDLCLVAHAYAQPSPSDQSKALFEALRNHLQVVALLQLSTSELAGLSNSFSKLKHAEDLGHVTLFDQIGRQMIAASENVGLRDACVALNAFAQAYVRHEPFFAKFEVILPQWLNDKDCNMRQLAMIAHAYVRVGILTSTLLPLLWIRAARLAKDSDAHSLSLMLFAITKASAVGTADGEEFVREFGNRLIQLLAVPSSSRGSIDPATVAVTIHALVRGGCVDVVNPVLWQALASAATKGLHSLPLSEASNIAAALVQVSRLNLGDSSPREAQNEFFKVLQQRIETEMAGTQQGVVTPIVASKLISALGDARCYDSGRVAHDLARRCLVVGKSARLGVGPLRSVARALVQLRVHDDDLIQALTIAQKPRRSRG